MGGLWVAHAPFVLQIPMRRGTIGRRPVRSSPKLRGQGGTLVAWIDQSQEINIVTIIVQCYYNS